MTTSSLSARFGPVTWLILQGAATVASILLAFGIDAWWNQRREVAEKNAMLESVKQEMRSDLQWAEGQCAYRQASLDNLKVLLTAAAAARYEDEERTLDQRLGELIWYSNLPFSTGAVSSLLSSGRAAAIDDVQLRAHLAAYPREIETSSAYASRDRATLMEVVAPFLSRNANLLQINNESYRQGRPGDGRYADPTLAIPVAETTDETSLLNNREFPGVLIQKMWIDVDVQSLVCIGLTNEIYMIIDLIDKEIENTS